MNCIYFKTVLSLSAICTEQGLILSGQQGNRSNTQPITSLSSIQTDLNCAILCIRHTLCEAFNYDKQTLVCELVDDSAIEPTADSIEWMYYHITSI